MIAQFVVQKTHNRATIYALDEHPRGHSQGTSYISNLTVVASLSGPHVEHADWAVWCMNEFLCGGPSRSGPTDENLHFLRSKLPRPVWQSVATFLHGLAPIEPGSFDEERGQVVRDIRHFSTGAMEDLARIMESAFDLDLGLRIANAQCGSQIEWIATVRTSTGTYRNDRTTWSGERRTWTLPPHVELVETCHLFEDIYGALEIALAGASKGRRVRIHLARPYYVPFVDDDGPDDPDPDHYWVVDIFDAPVPDRFTETGSTREL